MQQAIAINRPAAKRLIYLCDHIPKLLQEINEQDFCRKPAPDKWSKKEIIGHLIDSATNNHQRFVRIQFEEKPSISYDQNKWNEHSFYQQINTAQIISFWTIYNRHLAAIIALIPDAQLQRKCKTGADYVTLGFLINDYVSHQEYHLKQVVSYP